MKNLYSSHCSFSKIKKILLALSVLLLASASALSQDERPKVAYVFSGGGAKGMAHVGVLKVLEEVGLQPDYITGTSMGSIMGGLYAIGYSAEEISQIIEEADWSALLSNEIPSDEVIMRRKHEYHRMMLELPIFEGKPELPSGVIEGQKLSELFSELTWRQTVEQDFTKFPTPFSCIATDVLRGERVEINSGDLSSAMRASMAIPTVFTPVYRDSSILVDGGVVRNFPVQEAIDMGADIIIGIYVGFDSQMEAEQLRSFTSVLTRLSLLGGAQDVEQQIPFVDILITPDLDDFTPADFNEGAAIIDRGEMAARERIDDLRALADSLNNIGIVKQDRGYPDIDSIYITDISILNSTAKMDKFILAKSGFEVNTWLTKADVRAGIDELFGSLFFDKVEYSFENHEDGYQLVLRIKTKPNSSVGLAVHYDNVYGPGLILKYTHLNGLIEGSVFSASADISESPQFRAYYDVHIGEKRNLIASAFVVGGTEKLPFYEDNVDVGDYSHRIAKTGIGLRQGLHTNNQIGADLYYRHSRIELKDNVKKNYPELTYLESIVYRGTELALTFSHNSFDSYLYPTRGSAVNVVFRESFGTNFITHFQFPDSLDLAPKVEEKMDPYWHFQINMENYMPMGDRASLFSNIAMGLSEDNKPFTDNFFIGGYRYNMRQNAVSFVGLHNHELLQGNFIKAAIAPQIEVIDKLYFSATANVLYVSDSFDGFFEAAASDTEDYYIGAGTGFTYKTPIGPISTYLGSRTDVWNPIWYVNIGFTF